TFAISLHQTAGMPPAARRQAAISAFLPWVYRRAQMLPAAAALELLSEARRWLEDSELLPGHLLCEAEFAPDRKSALMHQADALYQNLLIVCHDQAASILCKWGNSLVQVGEYHEADRCFAEAERIEPALLDLHKNWSSMLLRKARQLG